MSPSRSTDSRRLSRAPEPVPAPAPRSDRDLRERGPLPDWWARWHPPRLSLAGAVISALLLIAGLGLVFSAVISFSLYNRSIEARIDDDLAQEVQELRALAADPDPQTGTPFASVDDLLYAALQRNVPNRSEEFVAIIDGEVPFVSAAPRPMHLDDHEDIMATLQQVPPGGDPRYSTVRDSRGHEVRIVAVPVQVPGDPAHGIFVGAIDATAERTGITDTMRAQTLAGLLTLLLVAVVGTLVFRSLLRPLSGLVAAAERINDNHLTERVAEAGTQDLVVVSTAFNGMLDRIDGALRAQRALLDDVGHELRTPLTVIRGHLEILDADDADDVTATRALVLDEVDRMGRLVDELVLLAKSERADFLVVGSVVVDDVVDGVFERARTLADRHYRIDGACGETITGDHQRLTQALVQLTSNAIRHTGPGDQIGFGARAHSTEDAVEIWVRDTGSGIAPEDHARIFDRFERGVTDSAETGSSGLGLSIVAAIAKAHGGRVELASAPGRGSTFTLVIPSDPATAGVLDPPNHPATTQEQT